MRESDQPIGCVWNMQGSDKPDRWYAHLADFAHAPRIISVYGEAAHGHTPWFTLALAPQVACLIEISRPIEPFGGGLH